MKNNGWFGIVFFVLFIFIKHILLNRKFWPVLGYGIGVVGLIGVSIFILYVMFRPLIKR